MRRKLKKMLGKSDDQIDPNLMSNGIRALSIMNGNLATRRCFVGECLTLADIALVAYTRFANEGCFNLAEVPAVRAWVGRIEADLRLRR